MGMDSIFMGVMKPYTVEAGIIRVWCTPAGGAHTNAKLFVPALLASLPSVVSVCVCMCAHDCVKLCVRSCVSLAGLGNGLIC